MGLSAATRFDRIDVSKTMDAENVGLSRVVEKWGPLLRRSPTATLLGYFMDWKGAAPNEGNLQEAIDKYTSAETVNQLFYERQIIHH
jgi:hypothetical protein